MKRILIVDDQKINLTMTAHILSTQYKTLCATSGNEAIEIYKREQPDMILTDLHMPGMSGFELQSTLQALYVEQIPIMFMTSDGTNENESRSFEKGAVDFIRKPFRADVLLRRVQNILENAERIEGLKRMAQTDPMTGLLNKSSSQIEIAARCLESTGVLMMLDLDSFKLVNDFYGHAMGDRVLIRFADIIRSAIRSNDLSGRIGGDEFITFCQYVRDEDVIAEKTKYINDELLKSAKEFMGEDMSIPLGASVGAVMVPAEGTEYLTLFTKADKALYQVKQQGKHGYALYHEGKTEEVNIQNMSGIQAEMAALKERHIHRGAYGLPYEQFQVIYRFITRLQVNYKGTNKLALFTLSNAKSLPEGERREAMVKLYDVVCGSLRASDVVTERGGSTVLALLLEANEYDCEMIIKRVLEKWKQTGYQEELVCDTEMIRSL